MHRAVDITPKVGGKLLCDLGEDCGLENYYVKRDWRRVRESEIRAEGYDWFWPHTSDPHVADPGNQPFPGKCVTPEDTGPITLIHQAERGDGARALIVGTPTSLYLFTAETDGVYVDDCYVDDCYVDDLAEWTQIGSGYDVNGQRWQAVNVNGLAFISNGLDLPVSFRVGELEVNPVYEMRECGYARFGCIGAFTDTLMAGDVYEIQSDPFIDLMRPLGWTDSGSILATQSGVTVTALSDIFFDPDDPHDPWDVVTSEAWWIGRAIVWADGTYGVVTGLTSAKIATVDTAITVAAPGEAFEIRFCASQTGATKPTATAGMTLAGTTVTATSAVFTNAHVGSRVHLANGFNSRIVALIGASPTATVTVVDAAPETFTALPFWIASNRDSDDDAINEYPDVVLPDTPGDFTSYIVEATAPVFTADMVGRTITWDDGTTRRIMYYVDEDTVYVDGFLPITESLASIEKTDAYSKYDQAQFVNRYQYRLEWSALNDGRVHAPSHQGTIDQASNRLELRYPVKSIEIGDELIISGAGTEGGNFTATVLFIAGNRILTLDAFAETSVVNATVKKVSEVGSMAGFDDPAGDFSQIINMLELAGLLCVYKSESVVLCSYTGEVAAPFQFGFRKIPNEKALYYKNTLIDVGEVAHVWAGRNSLYRLDLTMQVPADLEIADPCKSRFFNDSTGIAYTDYVFSADNPLSKEIWFVPYPDRASDDKLLAFDYLYGSMRTSSIQITAAAPVHRPEASNLTTDDWFLMGTNAGELIVYGKADEGVASWGGEKEIFYRRQESGDDTKYGYESVIQMGMSDFTSSTNEKHVDQVAVHVSEHVAGATMLMNLELLGCRNAGEGSAVLFTHTLDDPLEENMIPCHYSENYIGMRLTVPQQNEDTSENANGAIELSGWFVSGLPTKTASWSRSIAP